MQSSNKTEKQSTDRFESRLAVNFQYNRVMLRKVFFFVDEEEHKSEKREWEVGKDSITAVIRVLGDIPSFLTWRTGLSALLQKSRSLQHSMTKDSLMLLDVWQTNGLSGGWMTSWSRHLRPVGEGANTQTLLTYFFSHQCTIMPLWDYYE